MRISQRRPQRTHSVGTFVKGGRVAAGTGTAPHGHVEQHSLPWPLKAHTFPAPQSPSDVQLEAAHARLDAQTSPDPIWPHNAPPSTRHTPPSPQLPQG